MATEEFLAKHFTASKRHPHNLLVERDSGLVASIQSVAQFISNH